MTARVRAGQAALAGAVFVVVEVGLAWMWPAPLDPTPGWEAAPLALALAALHAGVSATLGRRGVFAAATLWSLVWAFEGPRSAGASLAWGLLPLALVATSGVVLSRWTTGKRPNPSLVSTTRATLAWALTVSTLGALWTPAWRPRALTGPTPAAQHTGPNVLLVTIDTTRADTNLLDGLGPGWLVTDAVSAAPWTLPSLHSIFSGRAVPDHGGGLPRDGGWTRRNAGSTSIVWDFVELGYETHAISSNPHLSPAQGFADGFSRWVHFGRAQGPLVLGHNLAGLRRRLTGRPEPWRWQRDDLLLDEALAVMDAPGSHPRFVWVHWMSPHEYRRTPEAAVPGWTPTTQDGEVLRAAYAANVAATRARLERLLADRDGWIIGVTSDHGEALGERGQWGHGHHLHGEALEVQLAVKAPGASITGNGVAFTPDLLPLLLAAARGGEATLRRRPQVTVGGLRSAARFATTSAPPVYTEINAPNVVSGDLSTPDATTRQQLEALGYQDR